MGDDENERGPSAKTADGSRGSRRISVAALDRWIEQSDGKTA
jgi:hypothetical protein